MFKGKLPKQMKRVKQISNSKLTTVKKFEYFRQIMNNKFQNLMKVSGITGGNRLQ